MTQMKLLATRIPGFTTPAPAASTKVKRRGEIPLEDVLTTAETIAEHFGGTGLQVNLSTGPAQPVSVLPPAADKTTVKREVSAHLEGFHAEIASLKDQSVNQEKRFQESIAKMEANLKQSFNQSVRDSPPHKDIAPAGEASNRWGQDRASNQREPSNNQGPCWYCGQGHRMSVCHFKQEHIDMGYITFEGGLVRFGNGGVIPKYPENKTKKEKVDEHYSNLGKPRGASLFSGQSQAHVQFIQNDASDECVDYDSRDDELRALRVQINLQKSQFVVPQIQMNPIRHPQVQQNYLGNEAQQFIQLPAPVAGHYREKLTDYPLLTGPLHDLIKSNAEWKWGNRQEDAFIELKHHLYLFVRREVRKRQNDGKVDLDETPPPSGKSSPPRKIQLDDDYSEEEPPEVEFVRIVDQSNNANSGVRKIPKTPKPQATCANPETRDSKRVGWTHREYLGT
ncbi:hypothetical protein C8F04DRAFT_1181117 [Mycena alexandri]|uniref:Uncharacterized protein n=1 Tax=Mycena alexandri TaxID=1745969 RepID=A0AAD6X981_9AGAR|nr:hypothetical protein C8F04DRAFT_1181117 [Mycena alexandri]